MDLSTYDGLLATAADWLDRSDLATQLPLFVQLVESKIRRRVRRKVIRNTVAVTGDALPLPGDCAELRALNFVSGQAWRDKPIDVGSFEQLAEMRARHGGVAGRPRFAAIAGTQLLFAPAPDSTYSLLLTYFEKLVPLTSTNQTNSVLQEAPDIYLFGICMEAAPYLQHDERIAVWETKLETALGELDAAREKEESSASIRPARLPVVFG